MTLRGGGVGSVPVRFIDSPEDLRDLQLALRSALHVAIDTETVFQPGDLGSPGPLRVLSAAMQLPDGAEQAFVVDVRTVDPVLLAPVLNGVVADAWNANFDALVTDTAIFAPARTPRDQGILWWDAQLADALLHQGVTGFSWFHGLAWATERYLGISAEGKGTTQLSYNATSPLTAEQIAYAGADAVETLWVAMELRKLLRSEGLETVAALEMSARPFLDHMQRCGLGFDSSGYASYLDQRRAEMADCLTALAELTGGGQGNLFSTALEPAWNPASEPQAKAALNGFAAPNVRAYLARNGRGRLLQDTDSLTANVLGEIGGPLAETLQKYRAHAKVLSTYGDNLTPFLAGGNRFHPQYVQVVGVNTGRLSARNPNVQTFPPELKPFIRPLQEGRVFVHADVSQAELRWLAQVSVDSALRSAFHAGADVHLHTAGRMFGVDIDSLEPKRRAELRARAKTINFGIVYGQGARALARSLTHAGAETSVEDGQRLLASYLAAYPQVAAWVSRQDRLVDQLATSPPPVDWVASLRLYDEYGPLSLFRRAFRDAHRRWPTESEIRAERSEDGVWASRFEDAMVLGLDGVPIGWESRTIAGRRRRFTVGVSGLLRRFGRVLAAANPSELAIVLARHGLQGLSEQRVDKVLEDRILRRSLVDNVLARVGWEGSLRWWQAALKDSISAMVNAHRNAPIQGGVADAMLGAYAALWARIGADDSLWPVLTVHDSIVVECPADRAEEVCKMVEEAVVAGFGQFCPDVPVTVDIDVRPSLSSPAS